jgi:hypothetical protein
MPVYRSSQMAVMTIRSQTEMAALKVPGEIRTALRALPVLRLGLCSSHSFQACFAATIVKALSEVHAYSFLLFGLLRTSIRLTS